MTRKAAGQATEAMPARADQTASVIIVSRGRPAALRRCLIGVSQLRGARFEVVVVADPPGLDAVAAAGLAERIKTARFDAANISAARNIGIGLAAGDILAFIDDDAVPEPTWLLHLLTAFADPDVAAAGGFVRGRNGISYQWQARAIAPDGSDSPLAVPEDRISLPDPPPGHAVKTQGTNMAIRRAALEDVGMFDPAYRFYLDEADLNLRLAAAGYRTAVVPTAQVHHGYAASDRRRGDRVPTDLHEIAASTAVFLRRHAPGRDPAGALRSERAAQRARLLRHMVAGGLEPGALRRLLAGFDAGWADGMARPVILPGAPPAPPAFVPFRPDAAPKGHLVLAGRPVQARKLLARARAAVAQGHVVSLYLLSTSAFYHRVRFTDDGIWLQTGGLFGRSDRSDPPVRFWRRNDRIAQEVQRVAPYRGAPAPCCP